MTGTNMSPQIMIDGYNLAMTCGTGVSTYAFSLALAARDLGCQVDGLYGLKAPFNRKFRDAVFFEALGREFISKKPKPWQLSWVQELSTLGRARRAREIALDGKVITDQFEQRLPKFDRLFTAHDLFDSASRQFKRFGSFTTVTVPDPPDVMHWTYPLPIRLAGAKNIYTMHDLVPLRLPYASLDHKRYYHTLMEACVKRGDHICTVSEASRADILSHFPNAQGKITNTYQAVRIPEEVLEASTADVEATVSGLFNLPYKNYFLFFGAIEPKKNVGRLIEAYLTSAIKTPLVIVGTRAWGADSELTLIEKNKLLPQKALARAVRRIDYLPRPLLLRLVRGAKAVVFPSLYEGFGLPVLEAMTMGTPVITSRTSSMPEVAGNAALLVNPYTVSELISAMRQIDRDATLRERLSVDGKAQAELYSIARYQQRLSSMYQQVLRAAQ